MSKVTNKFLLLSLVLLFHYSKEKSIFQRLSESYRYKKEQNARPNESKLQNPQATKKKKKVINIIDPYSGRYSFNGRGRNGCEGGIHSINPKTHTCKYCGKKECEVGGMHVIDPITNKCQYCGKLSCEVLGIHQIDSK